MRMELIPYPVGPINPKVQELLFALVMFIPVWVITGRLLVRAQRVLDARDDAIRGAGKRAEAVRARAEDKRAQAEALLAEARHDVARIRQRAREEGAAAIAAARADAERERDALLAASHTRIESDRAAAEDELRAYVGELASELASRILGEPIAAPAEPNQ
jgi:F-type H+-transporting ATPase subunit b